MMKMRKSTLEHLIAIYAGRQERVPNLRHIANTKTGMCNLMRFIPLLFAVFSMFSFKVFSQDDFNNIKIWEGWKLGNVIKVSGIIKYGNPLLKDDYEKRRLFVQKIDEIPLASSQTIQIAYDKDLFSRLKNNDTVTFLGYVSGGYSGIPKSNDYDIEYWTDVGFHFALYFVVLKEGDEIKKKKK